jgi:hypothetical protein
MKKLFTLLTMLVIGISGMWGQEPGQEPILIQNFVTSTPATDLEGWTDGSGKGRNNGVTLNTNGMTNEGSWSLNYAYTSVSLSNSKKYIIKYETYKSNTNDKDVNCTFYLSSSSYSVCIGNSYTDNQNIYVGELGSAAHGYSVSFQSGTGKNPTVLKTYNKVDVAKKLSYTLYLEGTSLTGTVTDGTNTDNIDVTLTNNSYAFTNIGFVLDAGANNVGITKLEVYEQRRIISMNFGNQGNAEENDGLLDLPAAAWNNVTEASNTKNDLTTWTAKGMQTLSPNWSINWSAGAVWKFADAGEKILKGYLDDGNTNQATVTFTNVPFATGYDVYIYKTSDTRNVGQSPITITSGGIERSYTTSTDGEGFFGTDYWGETQYTTSCLGKNVIVVRGLTATTFTIKGGGRNNDTNRGAIAAIQLVETGISKTEAVTSDTYDASDLSAPVYLTKTGDLRITGPADKIVKYVDVAGVTGTATYVFADKETSDLASSAKNNAIYLYSGGAGTSESHVSINHNGGSATLTGDKTYYLTGSNSATQTTINFDGTNVNYSNQLGVGTAIYNINNTKITTPSFITSQGGAGRPTVVNLTGNSVITVTGNSNVDTNESSIMIGHWNGSSNVTLSGTAQIVAADAQLLVGKTSNNQTITLNGSSNITAKGIKVSSGASSTSNILNLNGGSLTLGDVGITSYSSSKTIAVNVNENTTITANAATLPLTQPITVAAGKTLTIDGGTSNAEITLPNSLTNNGTIHFKDATLTANLNDRSLTNYTFTNCTATLQFIETTDEYKAGGFTITNIPSGVTVKVKKYGADYETVTPTDGTVTISHSVEVSGSAAWLDYTFNLSTKDKNTGTSGNVIKNAGNAGESGNDLTLDSDNGYQYTPSNSYNDDGTLKVMSTPYRTITWPTNYTVAVAGNVPDVENGCLVAFGTLSGGYLAILRGDASNKILLVKGKGQTPFNVITEMTAANATELSHLVVFTKNGNTFTVYLDGVQKAQVNYSETLGNGFQVGSLHGGIINTGIERVTYITDETKKAKVFAKGIRVYNYVISDDQMNKLKDEFPYVSQGGTYSRTISGNSNLSATDAWLNKGAQGNVDIPVNAVVDEVTYYPDVEITTDAASTLTVNADMDAENIKFDGTGKLTIASDGVHNIHIYGSVTANGPVSVKYGEIDLTAVPVSIGESGSVEFDFSASDFSSVDTPTDYPVTGHTADYGSKVTGVYPSYQTHTYTLAHNGTSNNYILTVAPTVAFFQQRAINLVKPYYDGGYVGTGLGKYTISLGETSYAEMYDFENAVMSWESLEDCVEPTISLNMPANGFYRFKSQNNQDNKGNVDKYIHNYLHNVNNGCLALNDEKDETTIFYVDCENNRILSYADGKYLYYWNQAPTVGNSGTWTIMEGSEIGKYAIKIGSSNWYASDWNTTDHITNGNKDANALWAIEAVDELPLTLSEGSYTSFSAPVPIVIPEDNGEDKADYYAYYATSQDNDAGVINMRRVTGKVPEDTGLIIYTNIDNPTIQIAENSEPLEYTNLLVANVAASNVSRTDNYFFGKVSGKYVFTQLSGTGDYYLLPGHKAYLNLSGGGARMSINWGVDDPTGLSELRDENIKLSDGKYYQNGRVVIVRNGVKYNVAGQTIK